MRFDSLSRNAFLKEVSKHFAQLLSWVDYCYASENAFPWTGEEKLRSVTGVQQGDPLGPFLFSLVLHPLASALNHIMHSTESEQESTPVLLHEWYFDGIIIAKHEALTKNLHLDKLRANLINESKGKYN